MRSMLLFCGISIVNIIFRLNQIEIVNCKIVRMCVLRTNTKPHTHTQTALMNTPEEEKKKRKSFVSKPRIFSIKYSNAYYHSVCIPINGSNKESMK